MITIAGLGNPEEKYIDTRHNTGRNMAINIAKIEGIDLEFEKKLNGLYGKGKIAGKPIQIILPDTYMNKSGESIRKLIKNKKDLENLVVIYDDLDLPVGKIKISKNRSSGGHKGLESVIKILKSENFIRIRIGISPKTGSGKIKKPVGEEKVLKHVLGKFKPEELSEIKKAYKRGHHFLEILAAKNLETAMSQM